MQSKEIADPTRVEVGFCFRTPERDWRSETLHEPDDVINVPGLSLAVVLGSLYERVMLTPRPRPRLVWDEAGDP